jgi:hypothetical protein
MINLVLMNAFSLESAPFNIYSLWGMILVEGLLDLPIAYLIIAPAMASFDVALEESSRVAARAAGAPSSGSRCRSCARRSWPRSSSASCAASPPLPCPR